MKHSLRPWFAGLALAALALSWAPAAHSDQTAQSQAQGQLLDQIIAVVNDDIILQSELGQRFQQAQQELRAQNINLPDRDTLIEKVLDQMILEKLQMQRVAQMNLQVTDQALFEQMQSIARENNLTLAQLRDNLNQNQNQGFAQFREQIRQQMLFQQLQEREVLARTQVTENEVAHYLQRQALSDNSYAYRLQHLLISLPEAPTAQKRAQARQKAEKLRQQILDGDPFSKVAAAHSDGQKALQGGDLGWMTQDKIPTFFSAVVTQLTPGAVSDLIRSPLGYHLIKLQDKRRVDQKPLQKQYRLHQFLLLSDQAMQAEKPPQTLVEVAQSIDSVQAFNALKTTYTDMPASVNANTDLGWLTPDQLSVTHARLIEQLSPGEAARPFATDEGWMIVYLDQVRTQDPNAQDKRKKAIETLRRQKANESFEVWLRRLKDQAMIDIRLDKLKQETTDHGAR
mgnify:FL=1